MKTFLVINTQFKVILEMIFLNISNVNMLFGNKTPKQKFYTTSKTLLITKQVQLIDSKKFNIVALNVHSKTFIVFMAIQE